MKDKIREVFKNLKEKEIVVNNITNAVTANACANIQLAIGVKPMMSTCIYEIDDVLNICSAININIGQASESTGSLVLELGKKANELNIPLILDPVGVSAFKYRFDMVGQFLKEIDFAVIKGNVSEIKTLEKMLDSKNVDSEFDINKSGIDVSKEDEILGIEELIRLAKNVSKKTKALVVISGAVDIIAKDERVYSVYNGHKLMAKVTGTGCSLSALISAFVAAYKENILFASVLAVASMGICGEIAYKNLLENEASGTYMNRIIDAVYNLNESILRKNIICKEH